MIKQLLLETGHNKIYKKLPRYQQNQYNNIMADIEAEDNEYIVSVDLAHPEFSDKSVICKSRYIDGVLHFDGFIELKDIQGDIKLGDGKIVGGNYYE
jgi:hypothetical protein